MTLSRGRPDLISFSGSSHCGVECRREGARVPSVSCFGPVRNDGGLDEGVVAEVALSLHLPACRRGKMTLHFINTRLRAEPARLC